MSTDMILDGTAVSSEGHDLTLSFNFRPGNPSSDGNWHQVAAVLHVDQNDPDVRVYLDGKMVPCSCGYWQERVDQIREQIMNERSCAECGAKENITIVNGKGYCVDHIDVPFRAIAAVRNALLGLLSDANS